MNNVTILMLRRLKYVGGTALLVGLMGVGAAQTTTAPLQVVDIMPAFWQTWDLTNGQPLSTRVAAFRKQVIDANEQVYELSEFGYLLASDERVGSYLQSLEPFTDSMRKISSRIAFEFPAIEQSVATQLPGLSTNRIVIYFLPSLDHFVGQTHDLENGKIAVMFGIDRTAERFGADANLGPEVAHELFHIYQYEMHPNQRSDQIPLWQAVWVEGSAAYASQFLAPGTTSSQALTQDLTQADPATVKALACGVESHWSSEARQDRREYLDAGFKPAAAPAMGGYLIGYLVARAISSNYTIAGMAKLSGVQLEETVRDKVHALCISPQHI